MQNKTLFNICRDRKVQDEAKVPGEDDQTKKKVVRRRYGPWYTDAVPDSDVKRDMDEVPDSDDEKDIKTKLDKGVKVLPNFCSQTENRAKYCIDDLYILDFGVFFRKVFENGTDGIITKSVELDRDFVKKVINHWDRKIQAHLLVYMFAQTIANGGGVFLTIAMMFDHIEYIAMVLFTFFAGSVAYVVCYPTELYWGCLICIPFGVF